MAMLNNQMVNLIGYIISPTINFLNLGSSSSIDELKNPSITIL
jgi:hypothetical protein